MASPSMQQEEPSTVDNPANDLPIKLWLSNTDTNYVDWRDQMITIIGGQGYLGFINGTDAPPPETVAGVSGRGTTAVSNPLYEMWMKADGVLKEFMLSSVEDDIYHALSALETSREVWLALENRFQLLFDSTPPAESIGATPREKDYKEYLPLHRAAIQGDWEAAKRLFDDNPGSMTACICPDMGTALHVAVGAGKSIDFVEKLVAEIPVDWLADLKDKSGITVLGTAAVVGNIAAATILVNRMPDLVYIPNDVGDFPVQTAAMYAQRDMLKYLLPITKDDNSQENPYRGLKGLKLLLHVIESEFIDIALYLVQKYPELARLRFPDDNSSALVRLAFKKSVFCSGRRYSLWERFISSCFPVERILKRQLTNGFDIENVAPSGQAVFQSLHSRLLGFVESLGPIKRIKEKTLLKRQALKLVKCLSNEIEKLSYAEARLLYSDAIIMATITGVHEVIEVIVEAYPNIMYSLTSDKRHMFHMAVENRSENVYNLIYQMSNYKHIYSSLKDSKGNSLLHYAAKLGPSDKRNEISGAALQMQREIQWYKEVEKIVDPRSRDGLNHAGKSPMTVFTEEHKTLKEEGERWMKDTSNSCTIAAALIATVMFAAAITVPGGNNSDNGSPIFDSDPAFIVFAVSDAISLFTSVTSLLMFLAILTARYAEEDFLYVLPKRLIIGLGTLFLSITFMMMAFSATLYLVFGQKQASVLIPVGVLACLPVTSFVLMQFPLLVDLVSSTYGPGIFGKQSNRPFF